MMLLKRINMLNKLKGIISLILVDLLKRQIMTRRAMSLTAKSIMLLT